MTKEEILKEEFAKFNIIHGWLPETKQAVLNAMERWAELQWKDPKKHGFPPIGTTCAIKKNDDLMIGVLTDLESWDDWNVYGENENCVDEYLVLPQNK